jgi:hypothetical protein
MTDAPLHCTCRRRAATNLRCARCDTPICPDCSVLAPAGMLCRACGSPRGSRLFQVSLSNLARAYLACLGAAVFGGWLLVGLLGFGFFALWGAFIYGGLVAEVALRVTGRKRGPQMEVLAGVCSAGGLLAGWGFHIMSYRLPVAPATFFFLPTGPWFYLMAGIAVFAAVSRIRYI